MTQKKTAATRTATKKSTKRTAVGAKQSPAEITINVRPADKLKLEEFAKKAGVPLGIATNAAISAACWLIRDNNVACRLTFHSSHFLWKCINREKGRFTDTVPLCEDAHGHFHEAQMDAQQIGRPMADWCGSLVMIGLEALAHIGPMQAMTAHHITEHFIQSCGYSVVRKGGVK